MAYTSETLTWQSYEIVVRNDPDPFNLVSRHQQTMAHVVIRTVMPEKAPLPITETGYKPHFVPKGNIDDYENPVAFVREWLDIAAQSEEWKIAQDEARQMSLF